MNDVKEGRSAGEKGSAQGAACNADKVTFAPGEFKIIKMVIKDAEQGKVLWTSDEWDTDSTEEKKVIFPKEML